MPPQDVSHLFDLGYVDPKEEARRLRARQEAAQRELASIEQQANGGELPAAIVRLETLLSGHDDFPTGVACLAQLYHRAGNQARAGELLDQLTYAGIESAPLARLRGMVEYSARNLDAAAEALEYALALDGTSAVTSLLLGELARRRQDWQTSETRYLQALDASPDLYQAELGLARIDLAHQRWNEAISQALGVLTVNPEASLGHYVIGMALIGLGRGSDAVKALERFAQTSPQDPAPCGLLARLVPSRGLADKWRDEARRRRLNRSRRASP